ncbi:dienelactone hydrolase [Catenulispora sp. GP43]|uniref:alpha/beta hydrolase family protein n=1 Tax=Catenulispora sp. GP43 TaxID=3156263 RepID=UPI003517A955
MRSSRLLAASLAGVAVSGLVLSTAVPALATASGSATASATAPAWSASSNPANGRTLTLPAPQGRYATGESTFRLVDDERADPWVPNQPYRELMISVFYPAVHTAGKPFTNQYPAAAAAAIGASLDDGNSLPTGLVNWAATKTHSVRNAAMAPGRFPVVLYSPGAGDPRDSNVTLVENLASQGYVVVTIDHTGEAPATEFPDGHVVGNGPLLAAFNQVGNDQAAATVLLTKVMDVRLADTQLVLNRLSSLPHRLTAGMNLTDIGMFGHSAGGFEAAETMYNDPRVKAGVNLDGTMEFTENADGTHLSQVALHGLKQPLLLMGSTGRYPSSIHVEPSWASFWQHQKGWKADITLNDSQHQSFTDAEPLLAQLADRIPASTLAYDNGTVDPAKAVAADRALVDSFFERFLKGCDDHLLDGRGASQYPITFVK